ncbi:hypothetical protein E2C01_039980 [Portunus trituberculatus]|uniref:Uncharacterized protein n=1 Tax=Portunus trituberculatus TaxID=210409 RepID=A0A5B7FL84_PORTR|nr:hypothetical protein [Portunus trituberculatus]
MVIPREELLMSGTARKLLDSAYLETSTATKPLGGSIVSIMSCRQAHLHSFRQSQPVLLRGPVG